MSDGVAVNRYGLSILNKRAMDLGAELLLRSSPGTGTELILTGPMREGRMS